MTGPIDAADEAFHLAGDDPYWMESAWFGFAIPEVAELGEDLAAHAPSRSADQGQLFWNSSVWRIWPVRVSADCWAR
jgi:hypothetical protein